MPNYSVTDSTPDHDREFTLILEDDGTFALTFRVWDVVAGGAGTIARGRWSRAGDTIALDVTEHVSKYMTAPTTATVVGDSIEMEWYGTLVRE